MARLRLFSTILRKNYFKLHWLWFLYIFSVSTVTIFLLPLYTVHINLLGKVNERASLMRQQNMSHYIRPLENTFITDVPSRFLSNSKVEQQFRSLGVFICSDVKQRERRRTIRSTWGRVLHPKPIFLLGISENKTDHEIALEEASLYQDVIIEDFSDTYQNLTLKTMFALKHFLRLMPEKDYFLKIDDDVFLNIYNLDQLFKQYNNVSGIIGEVIEKNKAHRDKEAKWYTPRWMHFKEEFPSFINGPAYLISGSLVKNIYETALDTPLITLEDVFLTGIVANDKLKVQLYHNPGFQHYPFMLYVYSDCFFRSAITVHRMVSVEKIYEVWKSLQENHQPC